MGTVVPARDLHRAENLHPSTPEGTDAHERFVVRAAVADRYGPPETVHIVDVPEPAPAAGEVRVRVHATTVSRTDAGNLRGHPRLARLVTGLVRPKNPVFGVDFAGVVDAVGEGADRFAIGDRVFGIGPGAVGCHAEFMCLAEDGAIAPLPDGVPFSQAVLGEGVWYAKSAFDRLGVEAGDRMMVYGASGAIGVAAVQLAKARGAEVIAVVDTERVELARSLGADRVVDYTAEDYADAASDLDFVFDAVGKASYQRARAMLKSEGAFSATDFGPRGGNLWHVLRSPLMRSKRFVFPLPTATKPAIEVAADLVRRGELRAVVDRVLPFDEIVDAYRYVETGRKIGIVVLKVVSDSA